MISMGEDIELQDEVDEDQAPADIPAIEDLPDDISELKKVHRPSGGEGVTLHRSDHKCVSICEDVY